MKYWGCQKAKNATPFLCNSYRIKTFLIASMSFPMVLDKESCWVQNIEIMTWVLITEKSSVWDAGPILWMWKIDDGIFVIGIFTSCMVNSLSSLSSLLEVCAPAALAWKSDCQDWGKCQNKHIFNNFLMKRNQWDFLPCKITF